jgi:hypothetical protein
MIILCACGINILLGIRNIKRHTMLCPAHEICIISSYDEMDAWEARLRLAILALVPDSRGQGILADAILDAIRNIPGIDGRDMSVRKFFPKRFLIIFIMLAQAGSTSARLGPYSGHGCASSVRRRTSFISMLPSSLRGSLLMQPVRVLAE